jgi:hypothetical protein
MEWEWTRNEPGMTQENLMKILKFSNSGSFLGFLGILRIPEDSTRNWWGRVKTSIPGLFLPFLSIPRSPWEVLVHSHPIPSSFLVHSQNRGVGMRKGKRGGECVYEAEGGRRGRDGV